ncbi:MAG: hypothetical protein QOJ40_949 [Verrucomicrobiota bacterium]
MHFVPAGKSVYCTGCEGASGIELGILDEDCVAMQSGFKMWCGYDNFTTLTETLARHLKDALFYIGDSETCFVDEFQIEGAQLICSRIYEGSWWPLDKFLEQKYRNPVNFSAELCYKTGCPTIGNPMGDETYLSQAIEDSDASVEMRVKALYARATIRHRCGNNGLTTSYNDAIADYGDVLKLIESVEADSSGAHSEKLRDIAKLAQKGRAEIYATLGKGWCDRMSAR